MPLCVLLVLGLTRGVLVKVGEGCLKDQAMHLMEQWNNSIEVELLAVVEICIYFDYAIAGFKRSNDLINGLLFVFY